MKLKNQKKKNKAGFSIAEAIISIFIIGIALTTFMTVLGRMYMIEFNKRDYIIAASLAQEGVEIVRNIRDNNWKEGDDAFDSSTGTYKFPTNGTYGFDYTKNNNAGDSDNFLNQNSDGFYSYSSGTATRFKRKIEIGSDGSARTVKSTVTWLPRGAKNDISIKVEAELYPWGDK